MDLDETRTLLALAEEGSVSGAAERMGVSRATVRRRLAALEARVGVSLARSTEAGVELTAAGELYARHARAPVRELEAIGQLAERAGQDPAGTLDVALPVGASRRLGPLFVRRLLTAWPDLRVRLRATPDPVQHLSHGAEREQEADGQRSATCAANEMHGVHGLPPVVLAAAGGSTSSTVRCVVPK